MDRRLASGIRYESALSLIASVRRSTSLPTTFVTGLDSMLDNAGIPLHRGDVVELQGLPSSGKSTLLYYLAATTVLMRRAHVRVDRQILEIPIGGKEETVVWIDCTGRFDVDRLATLVRHQLVVLITRYRAPKGIGAPRDSEIDALVEECLSRLHVFSPTSMLQLAATVHHLPDWFKKNALDELGTVLLDGMSEFAWLEQYEIEQKQADVAAGSRPAHAATAATKKPSGQPPLRLLCAAVAHLRRTLAPLIFITQWVFRPWSVLPQLSQDGLPFYSHHYGPPDWPSILTPDVTPGATDDSNDPLDSPSLVDGRWPTFPLALHITVHPRRKPTFRKGVRFDEVMADVRKSAREREKALKGQGVGTARAAGLGTEGITCVVRRPGGIEVGSWDMSIYEKEIVT
ncbi:hypothetical protein BMF94_3200 [Rhodotorula taiwanensis]|uniref:DNA recombination and repair protein Rad51-like C-terminal domain-containing protein n=1 Tax=Rhodotorula taiwanensis TaxID=741276 RepID=A0A2S5BA58_9BASI|nr:hypothetical protein BMF94_3200 [Rhodotorula taiwanensis]